MERKKYTFAITLAHRARPELVLELTVDELAARMVDLYPKGYILKSVEDIPEHTLPYKDEDDLVCPSCGIAGKIFAHVCGYRNAYRVDDDDQVWLGNASGEWIQCWQCEACEKEFDHLGPDLTFTSDDRVY